MMQINVTTESKMQQQFAEDDLFQNSEGYYQKKYEELQQKYEEQRLELIEFKAQAHFWKAQFERVKLRQDELEAKVEELTAALKKREQELFGKKTEKYNRSEQKRNEKLARNRGQQPGSKGHGRREHENLPQQIEIIDLPEKEKCCPCCGLPYEEIFGTEDSEVVEINVSAYTRVVKRKMYQPCCKCNHRAQIITAPVTEKLLPKSKIGVSIWAFLLLDKYEYAQPLNRSLEKLSCSGLSLAAGTVTDGFQRLVPLFSSVYDAIANRNTEAEHWHADETGWKVFEKIEGKNTNNWYLWIFKNEETVAFKIAPTRSSEVLIDHFGKDHKGGILSVDRFSAYKAIAKKGLFILAFCWAHVRRDFLKYCKGYPELEKWGLSWIDEIGKLYHINNLRIQYREKAKMFRKYNGELEKAVKQMREKLDRELKDKTTASAAKKILESLDKHWEGLTVFVGYPQIPMDNNEAERGLRPSVVGRKNYYGSGAIWSAQLAAYLFSILGTMKLWGINPQTWLLSYLEGCAHCGGHEPQNIDQFLPWKMTDEQRKIFCEPPNIKLPITLNAPAVDGTG